jgi:plastocyanin
VRPHRLDPRTLAASAAVLALTAAACAPGAATWTYDPNVGLATGPAASGGSAAPSVAASASELPSAAASGLVGGTPAPAGSGGPVIDLVAKNVTFDQTSLTAQANARFQIQFDNEDEAIQHNVAIYSDQAATNNLFRGTIVTGPIQTTYDVPALPAGTYFFQCDVHPNVMKGTIVVH